MKKIYSILLSLSAFALVLSSCNKPGPEPEPSKGSTLKSSALIEAVCDFYETWEESRVVPDEFTVGTATLNLSEFLYAEASQLVNLAAGNTGDVQYESCKAATNPERDSYDKDEIAVTNGPADGQKVAEDISTIAQRLIAAAAEKKQIPNQTLVYRGSEALAFSTNRAIITIARTIAAYAEKGKLPETVTTEYLGATTSLKAFAEKFVKFLDVWEANVADRLSADGSHCSANNNPWERVHYIPIPYKDVTICKDNEDQYIVKDFYTFEIDGETYTSNKCWEIAIRGLLDLCTVEGNDFLATMDDRNKAFTLADGKSLYSAPIRKAVENNDWGLYPWYEHDGDGGCVKKDGVPLEEIGLEPLLKVCAWHVVRAFIQTPANPSPLGMIGNYQVFGTNPGGSIVYGGYEGLICPMRELLVLARFYKYILDNNITKNVYTALKDVKVSYDLYNQQLPLVVKPSELTFEAEPAGPQDIAITANDSWTANAVESWIHVSPASGAAGEKTITVSVDKYDVEVARTGSIEITCGGYTKAVSVTQSAYVKPSSGTLMEFAQAFSTCLDVWNATVGNVDADGKHNGETGFKNVHLLPIPVGPNSGYKDKEGNQWDQNLYPASSLWAAEIRGQKYSASQCWEMAVRGLMNMCTAEGEAFLDGMTDRNKAYTKTNGVPTSADMSNYSSNNCWGANPWYEADGVLTYNGAEVKEVTVDVILKACSWHLVRGLIKNAGNTPLNSIGNFQVFGTNPSGELILEGYAGQISPMRELIVMARIYKYIADNKITTNVYDAIKDVKFDYDMYHQGSVPVKDPTIKDFAKEYVKLLDIWEKTTGDVQIHETVDAFTNVHYIPMETKFTVGGVDYTIPDALEVAMRSYMLLMGFDGNETAHKGQGGYASVTPATMSSKVPVASHYTVNYWYMETKGNGGSLRYNGEANKATINMLENYSERNVNFALTNGGAWGNVAGYSNRAGFTEFSGCMIPGRCQMAFLRFFKYMLDNNLESFSFADNKNMVVDCTLWGVAEYDAKNW